MIVPAGFEAPRELATDRAVLRPLGPEHNASDHEAWTTSIDHIRSTPGFGPGRSWPEEGMSLAANRDDLEMHASHFAAGVGFTYTVLDRSDPAVVVGCVYIYPDPIGEHEVEVRSWVRADRADLDGEIRLAVTDWLRTEWPFTSIRYDGVDDLG